MNKTTEMALRLMVLYDKDYTITHRGNVFTLHAECMDSCMVHTFYYKGGGEYEYVNSVIMEEGEFFHTEYDKELYKLISIFFEVRRFYYRDLFNLMIEKGIEKIETCE